MDRNPMRVPMQSAGVSGHREGRAVEGAGLHAKQRCSSTEFLRAGETASESVVSSQTGNCVLPTKTTGSTLSSQILRHYPTGNARVFVRQGRQGDRSGKSPDQLLIPLPRILDDE